MSRSQLAEPGIYSLEWHRTCVIKNSEMRMCHGAIQLDLSTIQGFLVREGGIGSIGRIMRVAREACGR